MQYAITTDYLASDGCPRGTLQRIAAAGWRSVHWCHHWNDDFAYDRAELEQVKAWMGELGLRLADLHGSNGREKAWDSPLNYERQAGVELVRNRLRMAAEFGCDVLIIHPARLRLGGQPQPERLDCLRRSLDELLPDLARLGVRIALENMAEASSFDQLDSLLEQYPPERIGICFDSGHGNIAGNGLDRLEKVADRLIATHLHDNNGREDLHQPLFMGTVDWPRLAGIVRKCGYGRAAMSVEVVMKHSGTADEDAFLRETLAGASRFEGCVGWSSGSLEL